VIPRATLGLDALRVRDLRLVLGAAAVSVVGDGIVAVALAFAVLDLTGSAADLGIVLTSRTVALIGSLLIGGVLADRAGPRSMMIVADVVPLLAWTTVGVLLVSGNATVAEIAVAQLFVGAGTGLFNPASSGLIPAVAGERLQQANALRGIAFAGGYVAGPALAGVLVAAAGPGVAILVDAASFGASALLLARVRTDRRAVTRPRQRLLADLREGLAEVRSRTWVWAMIAAMSLVNMLAASFSVLGPLVAKRALGGAAAWASILSARAIGGVFGSLTALRFSPRRPLLGVTLALLTMPLPVLLLAAPAPLAVIAASAAVAGVGTMMADTLWETTLQRQVPGHARSRVSSCDWLGSLALQPLGYLLVAPLADAVGVPATLCLCAALQLAVAGTLLAVSDIRTDPSPTDGRWSALDSL
jgi:predicted MFS family arabinose efflux permease